MVEPAVSPREVTRGIPKRIQLSRRKGWRKPEGAIVVSRPSKWGNPWTAKECRIYTIEGGRELAAEYFRQAMEERLWDVEHGYDPYEHEKPGFYPTLDDIRQSLKGHDLACWCRVGSPCHADVLLEIANGGPA